MGIENICVECNFNYGIIVEITEYSYEICSFFWGPNAEAFTHQKILNLLPSKKDGSVSDIDHDIDANAQILLGAGIPANDEHENIKFVQQKGILGEDNTCNAIWG